MHWSKDQPEKKCCCFRDQGFCHWRCRWKSLYLLFTKGKKCHFKMKNFWRSLAFVIRHWEDYFHCKYTFFLIKFSQSDFPDFPLIDFAMILSLWSDSFWKWSSWVQKTPLNQNYDSQAKNSESKNIPQRTIHPQRFHSPILAWNTLRDIF